jgi:hypothetical protein
MRMVCRWVQKASIAVLAVFLGASGVSGACVKGVQQSLNIRSGPGVTHNTIGAVPKGSCRLAVETQACKDTWCRAFYDGKFGWVNTRFTNIPSAIKKHAFNYYILKAIYERVGQRGGRGYHLSRSYSQDMYYGGKPDGVQRFYYDRDAKKWVFPQDKGKTMCVAAVAEVMVEALNFYVEDSADTSVAERLPPEHFRARAKARHLRQHLWEYTDLGSKGAGHALERFNIGIQKKFESLVPGDVFKFSRVKAPGHSTVFIAFTNSRGVIQEAYNSNVTGFLYFSAQGSGTDVNGKFSKGLGFRKEYFVGGCRSAKEKKRGRCKVIRSGKWRPNSGAMYHPVSWGEVGKNYRDELAETLFRSKTGRSITKREFTVMQKDEGSWLNSALETLLDKEMDPAYVGYFEDGSEADLSDEGGN